MSSKLRHSLAERPVQQEIFGVRSRYRGLYCGKPQPLDPCFIIGTRKVGLRLKPPEVGLILRRLSTTLEGHEREERHRQPDLGSAKQSDQSS
ncbi:hypothetical protein U1Q18_011348 [Sarracenia purpurea var. burkii]